MNSQENNFFPFQENPQGANNSENQTTPLAWNETQIVEEQPQVQPAVNAIPEAPVNQEVPVQSYQETEPQTDWTNTQTQTFTAPTQEVPVQQNVEQTAWTEMPSEPQQQMNEPVAMPTFGGVTQEVPVQQNVEQTAWTGVPSEPQQMANAAATQAQWTAPQQTATQPMMGHGMVAAPAKNGNAKKIVLIVAIIVSLIVVTVGGVYGVGVNNKMQAVSALKKDLDSQKKELDDLQKDENKYKTLIGMTTFGQCVSESSSVQGGEAFSGGLSTIVERTSETITSGIEACKGYAKTLTIDGAEGKIEEVTKEIMAAYENNKGLLNEGKSISDAWKAFESAWKSAGGGGSVDRETYNKVRALAATAMGVDPASLGDSFLFITVYAKTYTRFNDVKKRQITVTTSKIDEFVSANSGGKSKSDMRSELDRIGTKIGDLQKSTSDLEGQVKTKESEVWNPFK